MKLLIKIILLIVFFPFPVFAYLDYPYSFNFQTIRSPLMPLGDEPIEKGHWSIRGNLRWINVWSYQRNYFIVDGEEMQIEPNFRYALSNSVQAGISLPLQSRGGGIMDSSIEAFHRGAGVTQSLRDQYPENSLNVSYEPYSRFYPLLDPDPISSYLRNFDYREYPRKPFDQPYPIRTSAVQDPEPVPLKYSALAKGDLLTYYLMDRDYPFITPYGTLRTEIIPLQPRDDQKPGDPKIHLQSVLLRNIPFGDILMGGIQIKLPVNSGTFFSTPGIDGGLFLTLIKKSTPDAMGFIIGISYTNFALRHFYGMSLPPEQWVLRLGLEKTRGKSSFFTEYVYFTKPTSGMGELSREGHQIAFGWKKNLNGFITSFAAVENIIHFGVTPDIGFQISSEMIL